MPIDVQPLGAPTIRFLTSAEHSGKDEGLGIGKHMVAQQVPLNVSLKPTKLHRQTIDPVGFVLLSPEAPFDPVYDPQRKGIRLPSDSHPRRIFQDPASDKLALHGSAFRAGPSGKVIEVVKIVAPEHRLAGVIPLVGLLDLTLFIEKPDVPATQKTGWPLDGGDPGAHSLAQLRCGASIDNLPSQSCSNAPVDLLGL